jgi:hypothetical protein
MPGFICGAALVMRMVVLCGILSVAGWGNATASAAPQTTYTLPQDVHWIPLVGEGLRGGVRVPQGAFYAYLRGKETDKCGQLVRIKFPDGFVYPWHVNHEYDIYTILAGTLVIGFDEHHAPAAERALPADSIVQGLATEPHYGRAVGETIFDVYDPCFK